MQSDWLHICENHYPWQLLLIVGSAQLCLCCWRCKHPHHGEELVDGSALWWDGTRLRHSEYIQEYIIKEKTAIANVECMRK